MSGAERFRVAIVTPVPFHYQAPLYRELARHPGMDLVVYFCSDETLKGADVSRMYRAQGRMGASEALTSGYSWKLLRNASPVPSFVYGPVGLVNPDIWREIQSGRFDAVLLQAWNNVTWWLAFLAAESCHVPVLWMTDASILTEAGAPFWTKFLKTLLLKRLMFKRAAAFLTSSEVNERFYAAYGVPRGKMVRMPYTWGYEWLLAEADALRPQRLFHRRALGIRDDELVLLYVGRLSREKGLFDLLRAHQQNGQRTHLVLVGDGPLRRPLERFARRLHLDRVRFMGFQGREALPRFYAIADSLVLPSEKEPWGMVVNEAMCFGLPVIVSDQVGAAPELILEGENGWVVPAGDPAQLAARIAQLMALTPDERARFGAASLARIKRWLSAEPAEQLYAVLSALREGREPSGALSADPAAVFNRPVAVG